VHDARSVWVGIGGVEAGKVGHGGFAGAAIAAVYRDTGRLIDHEHVIIFVHDGKVGYDNLRLDHGLRIGDGNLLAGFNNEVSSHGPAFYGHGVCLE
jgi:hypothetical protein